MPETSIAAATHRVTERQLEHIVQLAVTLSGRLTRVRPEEIAPAIAETLDQVAADACADSCQLIEFTGGGAVARVHGPTTVDASRVRNQPAVDEWLIERLARGELVTISRPEELPVEAMALKEQARRTGTCSLLGVPASVAGEVVCALVLDSVRFPRRWPPALVERLQLLAEILGSGLQRERNERTLRANVAVIEQLNARLEADNVYLKEEIKSYHDFDDIVGESAALRLALTRVAQVAPTNSTRAAARPDRHRQGALRARGARAEPAAAARAGARQLRGAAADAGRERAVRPREGRLHRRRLRCGRDGSSSPTAARSSSTRSAT